MRILVTGTSGHIGGAVAYTLCQEGHEVIGISRTLNPALPEAVRQYSLDITDPEFIDKAVHGVSECEVIVHAAASIKDDTYTAEMMQVNYAGSLNLLDAADTLQARCFIYLSSLSILGMPCEHPITEAHPLTPSTGYAVSKLKAEHKIIEGGTDSRRTISLRVSSPVGPGLRHRRIFRLFVEHALENAPLQIHGTGARRQDYVDVRDIAQGILQAVCSDCRGIYNLGSGVPVSNLELAQRCIQTLRSSSEIVLTGVNDPDDKVCWDLSIAKAAREFGYAPQFALEQSVLDLAAEIR
ncbi:MAG: NAD(P)-dependent oxidoreductase [Candidatus Hydrogenedentes bacterium]|nr:NAD(P)-dependent oxidoreductase [Candidatus Hydrogenedentota bacterium]